VSRSRHRAFLIVIGLLGAFAGLLLFGLPLTVIGWFESSDGGVHRIHTLGWAALVGILLTVPALAQLRRPEHKIAAMQQIAAVVVAVILGYTVAGDFALPNALVVLAILGLIVALHPARSEFFHAGRPSPPILGITLLAAIPLVLYALDQGELQRTLPAGEPHTEGEHWADMAKLAFAIPLVALVASLRSPGARIAAWSVGAAAALIGTASIVYPDQASSLGRGWGALALAVGLLFVAVAEWEARRSGTAGTGELRGNREAS
jgi:hypothetical protein